MSRRSTHLNEEHLPLLQGTLDLLVLRTLEAGSLHGYGIVKAIQARSKNALRVEQGSLYPALHRLLKKGWIEWEWGLTENDRRGKYYRLTSEGRRQLKAESLRWEALVEAMTLVLNPAQEN